MLLNCILKQNWSLSARRFRKGISLPCTRSHADCKDAAEWRLQQHGIHADWLHLLLTEGMIHQILSTVDTEVSISFNASLSKPARIEATDAIMLTDNS
jgi:hypothetical protein